MKSYQVQIPIPEITTRTVYAVVYEGESLSEAHNVLLSHCLVKGARLVTVSRISYPPQDREGV